MKKILAFLLVFSFVSVCLAGPMPPPRHHRHGGSFRSVPLPPPVHRVHHHGHSMHTRDWIGLGAFIFGTSIISNAIERQPVIIYQQPAPQVVQPVQPVQQPVIIVPSVQPVPVTPPPPPPQPPVFYYYDTPALPPPHIVLPPLPPIILR